MAQEEANEIFADAEGSSTEERSEESDITEDQLKLSKPLGQLIQETFQEEFQKLSFKGNSDTDLGITNEEINQCDLELDAADFRNTLLNFNSDILEETFDFHFEAKQIRSENNIKICENQSNVLIGNNKVHQSKKRVLIDYTNLNSAHKTDSDPSNHIASTAKESAFVCKKSVQLNHFFTCANTKKTETMPGQTFQSDLQKMKKQKEIRVLTLNANEHQDTTLYRLKKNWFLQFRIGPSLFGRKVALYCNYPKENAEFVRDNYRLLKWRQEAGCENSDDTASYAEIFINRAGSFHYYFTYENE